MITDTIAPFYISTEEDLRFQLDFIGLSLTGRTLQCNIRERHTNTLKVSLSAPANMTLVGAGNLTVFYPLASMAGWSRMEYEADILDITGGTKTRIMAVRFTYDFPGNLPVGVAGNQATVQWGGNKAVVTAIGGVGPPGPVNVITIGTVTTLETGEPATASLTGSAPTQVLNLGLPKGGTGDNGWTPELAVVSDGARRVHQVVDWFGGEGTKPATGDYIGPSGFVAAIGDANDIRGSIGLTGDQGEKGWSPLLAMVPDGARRVLQIQSWTGGEGTPPASGGYLGPAGIVVAIGDATDFRGEPGASVGPGSIGTDELADGAVTEEKVDPALLATLATQEDLEGYTPRTALTGSSAIPSGTTGQRDGTPAAGYIRFNTTTGEYEGHNGTAWVPIGGGGALVADTPPTANLREGLLWFSRSWGALFVYYVDVNGGNWVSTTPVIDPSAFVLKSSVSAFMQTMLDDANAAAVLATLGITSGFTTAGMRGVFYTQTAPAGWLKSNGAAVDRTVYSVLDAAIYCGDANNPTAAWGYRCTNPASPTTTRSISGGYTVLPDERGEFQRGWDDGKGTDSGRSLWSMQLATRIPSISVDSSGVLLVSKNSPIIENDGSIGGSVTRSAIALTDNSTTTQYLPVRPRNIAGLVCIKYL